METNKHLKTASSGFSVLCIIAFLLSSAALYAQNGFETELANLKKLETTSTEKVYLQLDRTIFSPEEDLWFKAYLLDGTFHRLTPTSNNLHVELIAPDGKIVSEQVALIYNGVGHGDIHLESETIKDGVYQIRAYTNFMRNFDEALFFRKNILITSESNTKPEKYSDETEIDLQFFPEGGQLVQNILNRIAFKAVDQDGNGANISISIIDESGNELQQSKSIHEGMGQFLFSPKPNTAYYAQINLPNQTGKKFQLPKASDGYSILVGNQFEDLLDFTICTSPGNINNQQVSYIIQSRGKLFSSNKIQMDKEAKLVRIKKEELPSGISSITIFDEHNIPVCERLIYNQISPKLNINVTLNDKDYTTRDNVSMTVETKDENGKPVPAHLSMSVISDYIDDKQNELLSDNSSILATVLLSSDIKGKINNPDFYFENFDTQKHYYLDLLLLTQGWRKYIWKEKVDTESFVIDFKHESGFTLTGTSKTLAFKRPIPDSKVSLTITDNAFYYDEVNADENGKFTFSNTHFMDSTTLVFQAFNRKDKRNTVIDIDEISYSQPPTNSIKQIQHRNTSNDLRVISDQAKKIEQLKDSLAEKNYKFLNEITIKAQKRRDLDDHFRLYHNPDEVLEITDKYAGYNNILEIVEEQIPSIHVYGFCPDVEVRMRGTRSLRNGLTKGSNAAFLLDGMFVENKDICSIAVTQVDKVEILKGASATIFGSRGMNGIIAVYLKKSGVKWDYVPVGIVKTKPRGYYRSREFYSPNYEETQEEFQGPDYRNTLYWEPNIVTDKDGKAELSFFNSDDSGRFRISLEGVGIEGGLGQTRISYNVQSKDMAIH